MLTATILNSDATLNNFINISTKNFIPGEAFRLVFRIINLELSGIRYTPASTNITTVMLTNQDGTHFHKIATMFTDDRSINYIDLTSEETAELEGGNLIISLDLLGNESNIRKALVQNALARNIEGNC